MNEYQEIVGKSKRKGLVNIREDAEKSLRNVIRHILRNTEKS
jgi:hypothetical protein